MLLGLGWSLLLAGCSNNSGPAPQPRADGSSPAPTISTPSPTQPRVVVKVLPGLLPIGLQRSVVVSYKNEILVAGGLNASDSSVDTVYEIDPRQRTSRLIGHVAVPFHDAAGAVIGGRLFIFGGGSSTSSADVQSFDPSRGDSKVIAQLPTVLSDLSSASVGPRVFLVGGFDGTNPQSAIYETSDGAHFKTVGHLPLGLRYASVTSRGARVLIAGGFSSAGPTRSVYSFDPRRGTTKRIGALRVPVGHAATIAIGSTVLALGGQNAAERPIGNIQALSPTKAIELPTRLPGPRSDAGTVGSGGATYLVGGWDGSGPLRSVVSLRVAR